MYISKLVIDGFRSFKHSEIIFQDGLNVLIGHNNGGKSTIMEALRLVLEYGKSKNLSAWDFCQNVDMETIKKLAPCITISVYITEKKNENLSDDIALFTNYAVQTTPLLESCLTYVFYLPQTETENFQKDVSDVDDKCSLFKMIEDKYIRKYTHTIYGGPPALQNRAESEDLKKIDFEFVDALRNVEADIYGGKAALLRDVLRFFLDFDLNDQVKRDEIVAERHKQFKTDSKKVLNLLIDRIKSGKDNIIDYANRTGALFSNSELMLEGEISEIELLSVLNLLVEDYAGHKLPISFNGLGYNNLIYISLLLAKMQSNAKIDFWGSSNVKAFSVLAIEEPEAHLHPQMQYQFLEFLRKNIVDQRVKQVFVTSHSPSLVANVKLDELCCLHRNLEGDINIYSPKKVFEDNESDKHFFQRFLDSTRADMLFAGGVIFVEGITEQILLPVFARLLDRYDDWLKKHVIVINIGGRYFDTFLKLYDSNNPNSFSLKVACVTDRDPVRKNMQEDNSRFSSCWPIEYESDKEHYVYKNNADLNLEKYHSHPNIRFFSQNEKSKTLEYELALCNFDNKVLLVPSLSNMEELKCIMESDCLSTAITTCKSASLKEIYSSSTVWNDEGERHRALFASRYLDSVSKGANALELANAIMELTEEERSKFIIPEYIKESIEWVLN